VNLLTQSHTVGLEGPGEASAEGLSCLMLRWEAELLELLTDPTLWSAGDGFVSLPAAYSVL